MKKFEITKEQILLLAEQHSWSESKLKEWFPQAFESELEVGKWYTPLNECEGIALVCVQNPNDNDNLGYGFDWLGNWKDKGYTVFNMRNSRPATDKEVETALIAEAKRRGFKEGAVCLVGNFKRKTKLSESNFKLERNLLCVGADIIFNNGKWAEIISKPIELTLEQRIERIEEQLKIKK